VTKATRVLETDQPLRAQQTGGTLGLPVWQAPDDMRFQFRRVAAALSSIKGESFAVAVCSAASAAGVTWVTGMLACAVAESSRKVAVADTSVEPGLCGMFAVGEEGQPILRPSLTDFRLYPTDSANLSIFCPRDPRTTSSEAWVGAVTALRSLAPAVLVDCGALDNSAKVFHLSAALDGVVLVVEAERERRDKVAAALATLRTAGIHVLGVVLNKRRCHVPSLIQKHL